MKKITGLFTIMIVCLSLCSFSSSAQSGYDGRCGENITYRYDEKNETLYIEGSGKMYDYTQSKKIPAGYKKQPKIFGTAKNIVVSDEITYVGKNAFSAYNGLPYLETIIIGKDVRVIGDGAFRSAGIEEIIIPDNVESIGAESFENCNLLESVVFGKSVKSIGKHAFYVTIFSPSDPHLKKATVPESVEYIGSEAFGYVNYDYVSSSYRLKDFIAVGKVSSSIYDYCQKNGIAFDDIDGCGENNHKWGSKQTVREKRCGKNRALYCKQCIKCGSRRYEQGTSVAHRYLKGSKTVIKKATYFEEGKQKKYCLDCNKYVTIKVPKRELPYPENKKKKGKNQISYTFTDNNKNIPYYKVVVYTTDKYGSKDEKIKTYTVKNKKLTVKNLKRNTRYCFVIKTYYKKGDKVATRRVTEYVKTLKK